MEGQIIKFTPDIDLSYLKNLSYLKKKRGCRKKVKYLDTVAAFDIESTNLSDLQQAFMYTWQWSFDGVFNLYGRTWEEFRQWLDILTGCIPEDHRIVCYVHNLSYEFQFLKSIIDFDDVFATGNRTVLRCIYKSIEFRCSYLQSNMSLDRFLKYMDVQHKKVANYDYLKIRYPWTPLTDKEIRYIMHDVIGLCEAIRAEMGRDNDDLYTIPLTSTGYERREAKRTIEHMQPIIKHWLPEKDIMLALRKLFRGGNTHANRHYSGLIVRNVHSVDLSSCYIAEMLRRTYPKRFYPRDPSRFGQALRRGRAIIADIEMFDVRLKRETFGCPYLASAKCDTIQGAEYDNGRILRADYVRTTINEVDYHILCSEYDFTFAVIKLYTACKAPLPKRYRDMLLKQYREKTELKGGDAYLYSKKKNLLNSSYGMMVQNPIKPDLIFKDGIIDLDPDKSVDDLIDHYLEHGWLPYQWGCWVTSYARLTLERGIQSIPDDAFLYTDTDSIKFTGDYLVNFLDLNAELADPELSAVDPKGKRHYLGVFEYEGCSKQFITLGAKKYAYTDDLYNLHLTVAGVNKRIGALEMGSIHRFREGFVFREAGGSEVIYNDEKPADLMIDGRRIEMSTNAFIHDSTYTLSLTMEYRELIDYLKTHDIRYDLHYE